DFLPRLRFPAVHQRRGRPAGFWHPLGLDPPTPRPEADAADLVPLGRALDPRAGRTARAADGVGLGHLARRGTARLNRRYGRLAQLVRASRLHRDSIPVISIT